MATNTYQTDLQLDDNIRLCRLCLWTNYDGFGLHLNAASPPPHFISRIESNSPAAASGLKIRDVILHVNDLDVTKADFTAVETAIKASKNISNGVDLLVIKQSVYKLSTMENIMLDCIPTSTIITPSTMPAKFLGFSRNTPRLCQMRLGSNDSTFGIGVADGENHVGAYIRTIYANSLASHTELRESDRIIEINGRNVDKDSSEYIGQKLEKAKKKGKLKLFVADVQTYEYYMKNKLKFKGEKFKSKNYSTNRTTFRVARSLQQNTLPKNHVTNKKTTREPPSTGYVTQAIQNKSVPATHQSARSDQISLNDFIISENSRRSTSYDTPSISTSSSTDTVSITASIVKDNATQRSISIGSDYSDTLSSRNTKHRASSTTIEFPFRNTRPSSTVRSTSSQTHYRTTQDTFKSTSKLATSRYSSVDNIRTTSRSTSSAVVLPKIKVNVRNGTIQVCQGDLTEEKVDAIVVASTSDRLTANVLRKAGKSVSATYESEKQRKPSKAICTAGGQLSCEEIYFIPCPKMSKNADKSVFRNFIGDAFVLADNSEENTIQSIAFPALGCGQYGCNPSFVAETLIMAVEYELKQRPSRKLNVCFVVQQHQQHVFDAFQKKLTELETNQSSDVKNRLHRNENYLTLKSSEPHRRLVDRSSQEYTETINKFWNTMTTTLCKEIVSIELIWNERWYKQYQIHRNEFSQRLKNDTEQQLFHGCSEKASKNIIKECFNRSYAGVNGTLYGHGVYFSSKASYSHSYTNRNAKGERCMFLARVLIGKTTIGNSSTKVCPIGYDTTTDGSHIYVIYHDAQSFGQYLITYK